MGENLYWLSVEFLPYIKVIIFKRTAHVGQYLYHHVLILLLSIDVQFFTHNKGECKQGISLMVASDAPAIRQGDALHEWRRSKL